MPTVFWRGQIVEGRHRSALCRERGKPPKYTFIDEMNEEDVGRYVAALNQHRRSRIKPLTQEEERAKAEAAMRTDRRIAEACGISHPFVAKVRTEMSRRTELQPLVQSSEKTRSYTSQV